MPLGVYSHDRPARCSLHRGPHRMTTHSSGAFANVTSAINVKHHPRPIPSSMGCSSAVAPAPNRHRTKCLDAAAADALAGYKSTSKVQTMLFAAVIHPPMKNSSVVGTARCTPNSKTHPKAITARLPIVRSGKTAWRRAFSMGKPARFPGLVWVS